MLKSEDIKDSKGEYSKKELKNGVRTIQTTVDGKKIVTYTIKKPAPIISLENMIGIDKWTPEQYQEYYTFLMPFYKLWYNCDERGYRPVVKGLNLVANLAKNNLKKKCWCKECLVPGHSGDAKGLHTIFNPLPSTKLGCWRCEYIDQVPTEYVIEIDEEKGYDLRTLRPKIPRDPMISAFDRYVTYQSKLLYSIDMFVDKLTMFRGIRTMYWQPCIRHGELKNVGTDNSFNQIMGLNPVIDIDVVNKHVKTIFDYWDENFRILCDIAKILDDNGIEYRIMFSGNGWYFILKMVTLEDNDKGLDKAEFWNVVSSGIKMWLTENVKPVQEKYHFDIQVGNMSPMKFVKTPFSIHQRLDVNAVPITLDMLNSMNDGEFKLFIDPLNIKETYKKCESIFGIGMKDFVSW